MIPLAADENFHGGLIRGFRLRLPSADLVRVQDVGLAGAAGRAGQRMAGLILVPQPFSMPEVLNDLKLVTECYEPIELEDL